MDWNSFGCGRLIHLTSTKVCVLTILVFVEFFNTYVVYFVAAESLSQGSEHCMSCRRLIDVCDISRMSLGFRVASAFPGWRATYTNYLT